MSDDELNDHKELERRAFLKGAAAIGGLTAAAGWASLAPPSAPLSLKDPDGERGKPKSRVLTLPDGGFAVAQKPELPVLGGRSDQGSEVPTVEATKVGLHEPVDRGAAVPATGLRSQLTAELGTGEASSLPVAVPAA